VFLTTHYLDEADKLADRVGIIDGGVLQCVGSPSELTDMLKGDSIALAFDEGVAEQAKPLLEGSGFTKEVLVEEDGLRIYVDNGGETIADLISLLAGEQIKIKSVTLARPTLDDVFIKFTGKSMDKVEEKIKPWWAEWAGDDWEQQAEQNEWGGNKWVNADGSAKDKEAFEEWAAETSNAEADGDAPDADAASTNDADVASAISDCVSEAESDETAADDKENDVSEENKDETTGGDPNWGGNEWVNKDGTAKNPEAMKKWLDDSAKKAE